MPTSTAATTMRASSPGGEPVDLHRDAQRAVRPHQRRQARGRRASVRALRLIENHCTPMARPGMRCGLRVERAAQGGDHIGAAAPVVADRHAQPRGARRHVLRRPCEMSRSPITLMVTLPAVRAVTATVMLSPGAYSGLSSAISSSSGVSALASAYQPASNADRRDRSVAIAGRHFEPIAAPLHRNRDACRACRRRRRSRRRRRAASTSPARSPRRRRADTIDTWSRP